MLQYSAYKYSTYMSKVHCMMYFALMGVAIIYVHLQLSSHDRVHAFKTNEASKCQRKKFVPNKKGT